MVAHQENGFGRDLNTMPSRAAFCGMDVALTFWERLDERGKRTKTGRPVLAALGAAKGRTQ